MLFSQDLMEKLVLLVATAAVTGFLLPFVLKTIDDVRSDRRKQHEADLARQGKIIEAQAQCLDELSGILWQWRYAYMKVVFYGRRRLDDQCAAAFKEYDDGSWDVLNRFRQECSKARRLVSETAYQQLLDMYSSIVAMDVKLSDTMGSKQAGLDCATEFEELGNTVYHETTSQIDSVLDEIASETHLKALA